jgi:hypothetical protein
MGKISKSLKYDDPTAFGKRWPRIERIKERTGLALVSADETMWKMGPIRASVVLTSKNGFFMSIHGRDRYPTWDEIVWLRYNLLPDAAQMVLILPNLNRYINLEDTHHKYVFTLEQQGWALDPVPMCAHCKAPVPLKLTEIEGIQGTFVCGDCGYTQSIWMDSWNEDHGNGMTAKGEGR